MRKEIREAYNTISNDYLTKKSHPWIDFLNFTEMLEFSKPKTVVDIGAGNGRNLHGIDTDLPIALELSFDLLLGYVGPKDGQKIAGALPDLPFRKSTSDCIISIAVLHHFDKESDVIASLEEMRRIGKFDTTYLFSVWRRWRKGYRDKIFKAIRSGKDIDPLINHTRPWYNSERDIVTHRFYHYYTFKEFYYQLKAAEMAIKTVEYIGGRHDDANIFVQVNHQTKSKQS